MFALLVLSLGAIASGTRVHGDHPAVKIMALLGKLQSQVKEEGEAEAAEYSKFIYWCDELTKAKKKEIADENKVIAVQESTIEALTEDIALLTSEIEALNEEIAQEEAAKAAGLDARNAANGDFAQRLSDAQGTASSIGQAIDAISANSANSLMQEHALSKVTALLDVYAPEQKAVKQVHAFLQTRADPIESAEADQFDSRKGRAVVYDFKSGGIVEVLKQMKQEFEQTVTDMSSQEQGDAAEHALSDAAKAQSIAAATRSRDTKVSVKARKGQDKSTAESDLNDATTARNSATTVLDDTTALCQQRNDESNERNKRRDGEVEAMGQAIEILEKVAGVRSPESKGVASVGFVQLRKVNDPRSAIINLLRKAGSTKTTKALSKLADKIAKLAAQQTPGTGMFDQIKNMIQKMIFQLMSEQTDEDKHKNWCDKELETSTMMQSDKQSKQDELNADIAALTAEIQSLTNSITENDQFVASLASDISTETDDRAAAKAENEATIQDADDAQKAVAAAIAVLEDFYKSTGEVAKEEWEAFVQLKVARRSTQQPDLAWGGEGGEYKGTSGGSGVIGMLNNINSDFASMEAEARADETSQTDEFDEWLTTATVNTAEKKKDTEMKSARRDTMKEKLEGKTTDQKHTTKELDATTQYLADLQHACVDGDSSYAERKAARTQEIEALRQAQGILDSAAPQ